MITLPIKPKAIVIGASAGAIGALSRILPAIGEGFSVPILIVVHVPPDTKSILAELFASKCRIEVKEAEDKETVRDGVIYFAPPNYHLLAEANFTLSLSSDEPELFSRPSINVLFESAAEAYGSDLVGMVLTGASKDGASGLKAVHVGGGFAVVEDPEKAEVSVMPEAALAACPEAAIMNLKEMGEFLAQLGK